VKVSGCIPLPLAVRINWQGRPQLRAQWHQSVTLASDRVLNSRRLLRTIQLHTEDHLIGLYPSDLVIFNLSHCPSRRLLGGQLFVADVKFSVVNLYSIEVVAFAAAGGSAAAALSRKLPESS
jgi:hypothetical protein